MPDGQKRDRWHAKAADSSRELSTGDKRTRERREARERARESRKTGRSAASRGVAAHRYIVKVRERRYADLRGRYRWLSANSYDTPCLCVNARRVRRIAARSADRFNRISCKYCEQSSQLCVVPPKLLKEILNPLARKRKLNLDARDRGYFC